MMMNEKLKMKEMMKEISTLNKNRNKLWMVTLLVLQSFFSLKKNILELTKLFPLINKI